MFDAGKLVYHKLVKQVGQVVKLASNLEAVVRLAGGTEHQWRCTDCRTVKPAEALKYSDAKADAEMATAAGADEDDVFDEDDA